MKQVFTLKEPTGSISGPAELFERIKKFKIDFTQENFILICLNTKNQAFHSEVVFKGGLNTCLIDPRILYRKALLKNANSIIIAHNHPSGCLEPSREDVEIFEKLKDAGKLIQIPCLDFIVFNEKEFYSIENS